MPLPIDSAPPDVAPERFLRRVPLTMPGFRRLSVRLFIPCALFIVVFTGACLASAPESGSETTEAGQSVSDSEMEDPRHLDGDGSVPEPLDPDETSAEGQAGAQEPETSGGPSPSDSSPGADPVPEVSPGGGDRADQAPDELESDPGEETAPAPDIEPAMPDPETDGFTYTLPATASPLRLSLPADIEDIFYSDKTGLSGFGLHSGGHIEGLDHVWMELRPGTPVKSWADGVVESVGVSGDVAVGEIHIAINYGQNLIGVHMEIDTPYVEVGDTVLRGQEVGIGMSFDSEQSSAEMALIDRGRSDGVQSGHGGVYVSPYDYLEDSEKQKLVEAYKRYVIEPYQQTGSADTWVFEPYQPYLTNRLFLHEGNEGRLTGEWYLLSEAWRTGGPPDILTFIEADNPWFTGNVVRGADDEGEGRMRIKGTFEVDSPGRRLIIMDENGTTYYGIFEIDDTGDRATLTIEYRQGIYPDGFTTEAVTYTERAHLSRREDASLLGVLDSG